MEAAREGHLEMVSLLLEHGADIHAQTEETQETALSLACCGGFQDVAAFLLQAGQSSLLYVLQLLIFEVEVVIHKTTTYKSGFQSGC